MNVVVIAVAAFVAAAAGAPEDPTFADYVSMFHKPYASNPTVYRQKEAVYNANVKTMDVQRASLRAKGIEPWQGVNEFTDLTKEEFRNSGRVMKRPFGMGSGEADARSCLTDNVTVSLMAKLPRDIPTDFDWRDKNVVSPVQNQGDCGSCWAFSTASAIESATAVKSGNLTKLSEQEIVDCSHGCVIEEGQKVCNQGCNGGWQWSALTDIIIWHGLDPEDTYPYTGVTGTCHKNKNDTISNVLNYTCLSGPDPANEDDMASFLVANGPLSIAMDANLLQAYHRGIIRPQFGDCSKTSLDHAINIVGYGIDGMDKFWIVRNSWGESWGEKGYFRIARGEGACGLNEGVVFPIVP